MRVLKESFNAGEVSPRLYSRYELAKYKNGCRTLTNFIPLAHGSVTRRPGFEYIAEVKDSADKCYLIPFEFSETDAYIIEAGDQYFRFYKNGGQVWTADANTKLLLHLDGPNGSQTITDNGATGHSPAVSGSCTLSTVAKKFGSSSLETGTLKYVTVADHADWTFGSGAFTIDFWVYLKTTSASAGFFQHYEDANNQYRCLWNHSTEMLYFTVEDGGVTEVTLSYNWQPSIETWYHIAVIRGWDGNANDWAICVDGIAVDTDTVNYTISDFVGSFNIGVSLYYTIGYIDEFRVSNTARWTANFALPEYQYPYADESGTVYELATTYTQDMVDKLYFVQSADTMYLLHEDFVVRKLVRSGDDSWAISNVSFTNAPAAWSANDYPRTADFYEDRLAFGGSPDQPDTIWMTEVGAYTTFTATPAAADDSLEMTLSARKVNDILWISSGRRLIIGTRGEEWWASGPSDTEPIQYDQKIAKRDTSNGSERIKPINIGDAVFYVQRNGKIIRYMEYDFGKDKYISTDISVLAEHLTRNYKIIQFAYQQHPYQILWCVREDGTLLSLTFLKEHDVIGWAKHTSSDGVFESVATIPGTSEDEVWVVIKRTIDGSDVRYIEKLKPFNFGTALEDAFYVDSGLTYQGEDATTISGLDHLEGETVVALADGLVETGLTVSSGDITLSTAAGKVHIGLAYTPEFEPLDVVNEDEDGPMQGMVKRITNISLYLIDSQGGIFGPSDSETDSIPYDDTTVLYTGWTNDLPFEGESEKEPIIHIECDEPLPLEIGAISIELED